MSDRKGKGILIESQQLSDRKGKGILNDKDESQQLSDRKGKGFLIENDESQQRRHGPGPGTETSSGGAYDSDDEDNLNILQEIEALDHELAKKLQEEENARAPEPLQQEEINLNKDLPFKVRISYVDDDDDDDDWPDDDGNFWKDDGSYWEDPDLENTDGDTNDPPVDYNPALKMSPGRWRRHLPKCCICVKRTLTSSDVDVPGAYLPLDIYGAASLSSNPKMVHDVKERRIKKHILVYDVEDVEYQMLVTHYAPDNETEAVSFCISAGWDQFVLVHNLKVGDELNIYKTYDPRVCNEHYFIFKYFRIPKPCPKLKNVGRGKTKRKLDYDKDDDEEDWDKGDCDKGDDGKYDSVKGENENPKEGGTYMKVEMGRNETGGVVMKFLKKPYMMDEKIKVI